MVSLAGLSFVAPGFQQGQMNQLKIDEGLTEQAANVAAGNTIKMLQSQVPGAQPMPGQGPQLPQVQGMPQQMPQQPMQPRVGGAGPMAVPTAPAGPPAPMQQPPMQPQMQGAPQPQQMGGMPQGGGMGPGGGQLTWQSIIQKVTQANPKAPPQVIAAAVNKFIPLMNSQAQVEWKQMMMAFKPTQMAQTQERIDIARTESDRKREQGDVRLDQGAKRIDQGNRRLDQADTREQRLAKSAQIRQDQQYQTLEIRKQQLERQIQQGNDRQALGQWRAIVDAQHKRALEIIQSSSVNSNMKPEEKKRLLAEQDEFYRQQIEGMKNRMDPRKQNLGPVTGVTVQDAPAGAPKVGTVENGYRFKGGNPADQSSWEKVTGE